MTKRRSLSFTLSLVLIAAAGLSADSSVPFRATLDTQPMATGFCGPTCLQLQISGTGEATHLGRMSMDGPSQVNVAAGTQIGTFTFVAANGDSFDITISGTAVFGATPADPVTFSGQWTVTSGTGRFAKTTGGGTYHGSAEETTGILFMDGTLSGIGRGR
jgi:hypothetical protein